MMFTSKDDLVAKLHDSLANIRPLLETALFSPDEELKMYAQDQIYQLAKDSGANLASIRTFYIEIGKGVITPIFTVPACNIRTLTYDTARLIFRLMKKHAIGAVVFEIARSEMEYTFQTPREYAVSILAAAIMESYKGPVFIQGDHYQVNAAKFAINKGQEIDRLKNLIDKSIAAGFYNIDIDASTIVDLSKQNLDEQQQANYETTATLTHFIRKKQPENVIISVGAEIGHIGGKNSTGDDFEAFMHGFLEVMQEEPHPQLSKISVQTGTSHGGIPLPNGEMAQINVDFNVLKTITNIARREYHIGGAVQHGASTLPKELFSQFPLSDTLEIHLATGFQNIVFETIPDQLREEMCQWVKDNLQSEKDAAMTESQFIYKGRKKAFGPFKEKLFNLSEEEKAPILASLEKEFTFLFEQLGTFNTRTLLDTLYPEV